MKTRFSKSLFAILLVCLACLPAIAAETPEKAGESFSARQLWQAFQDSMEKAEQELIGKTVQIHGIVVDTGMSIYLTPNVKLSDTANGTIYVNCVLPRSDTGLLSEFAKGDRVTMSGRVYRFSANNSSVVVKQSQRVKE